MHDAQTITSPLPPIGEVLTYGGAPVVVMAHPGAYPEVVLVASEPHLRDGVRLAVHPGRLGYRLDDASSWDSHVLQALAVVAPDPHPQH